MTPELEAKIRDVLSKLAMLAEGSTTNFNGKLSYGATDSKPPPGTNLDTKDGIPDKDMHLYEWWRWRFANAVARGESEKSLYKLWKDADAEYMEERYFSEERAERRSGAKVENDRSDGGASERDQAERVATEPAYEGMSALEVALSERQGWKGSRITEAWVKKARRQHGRNQNDGKPRAGFLELDENGRVAKARVLYQKGMSYRAAAQKMQVAPSTMQRYWPSTRATAA